MMNHSAFDDHIKDQFGRFEPEVPPHIWENIAAQKDKRRPIAWWSRLLGNKKFLVAAALILIGATGIIMYRHTVNNQNISATITDPSPITVHTQKTSTEKNILENNTAPITVEKTDDAKPETKQQITGSTTSAASVPVIAEGKGQTETTTNIAIKKSGTRPTTTQQAQQQEFANNDVTSNATANKKTNRRKDASRMRSSVMAPDLVADQSEKEQPNTQPGMGDDPETISSLQRRIWEGEKLQDDKQFNRKLQYKPFNLAQVPCPEKNAAGNKKYIEFYGGPDYVLRSFNDTAQSRYLQKRKESTRFASAFSAGIRYTRVFSNAMSFRAGLNFSQVNERFRYVEGNIVQMTYIIDGNGDTTGSYSSTVTRYKTTQNRYKTIDIPVSIGYEMGNEKFHANINAGVVMNIYSWQKGDVLDTAYKPVSITTGAGPSPYQFKTNIGLGFMGAASLYYKLNNRFHLMAEPFIRYNLSAANKAEITLKQKFTTVGLRLGLRVDL